MGLTDKELLEFAAKAAGIEIIRSRLDDPAVNDMLIKNSVRNPNETGGAWNPLRDDGDALRLAVKLEMDLDLTIAMQPDSDVAACDIDVACGEDPYAATRRAIVLAAAEIGKQKG